MLDGILEFFPHIAISIRFSTFVPLLEQKFRHIFEREKREKNLVAHQAV